MSALELAVFAGRLGDLIAEARVELDGDSFGDFLVLAAAAISKRVADQIEDEWQSPGGSS